MLEEIVDLHRRVAARDRDLLAPILQAKDAAADYLAEDRTYAWHVAIGLHFKPQKIGEIGVRFGYALACLAGGSIRAGRAAGFGCELHGWDNESYEPDCLAIAAHNLAQISDRVHLHRASTRDLATLGIGGFDLFHVDGDHTEAGAMHDMALAWEALAVAPPSGGAMLVDDYHFLPAVRNAVVRWAQENRLSYAVLPTFRGTAIFKKE